MAAQRNPKDQIIEGAIAHLDTQGPPFASYANIADAADLSRQLMRYYFPEPDSLMLEVCDTLSEAYRIALSKGADTYDGQNKLDYVLDFYFGLLDSAPIPDHQGCNDALTAYTVGHPKIKSAMRKKYALMGQALQLEIKVAHPDLSLRTCSELAYVALCILQGTRKLTGTLGMSSKHNMLARKSIDRMISAAQSDTPPQSSGFDIWA